MNMELSSILARNMITKTSTGVHICPSASEPRHEDAKEGSNGGDWSASRSGRFIPGKIARRTHCVEGIVAKRAKNRPCGPAYLVTLLTDL
jgi:hypothetical protein